MRHSIEHVFFDLDRTLWDFDTNSREAIRELFVRFRIGHLTGAEFEVFHSLYQGVNEQYWERYRKAQVTQSELRRGRFFDSLCQLGHADMELADAMGVAYVDISPRKTALVDGALELLDYLNCRYALHIITNGFEEVQHIKLESSGIRDFFGEVITSERAGVKKPDAGIFRFAEQVTHALPTNAVMIGDHFEADVMGAVQAGWRSIYFSPDGGPDGDHLNVSTLREVMGIL
ncbi:MAG: YjjG family noncanonical pyrimidine nucleotidase [Flavobacteriales bacterium]|nr:YjjG family noncanonical pyrimidine nucleotidase [Flavobacteriales bacterium]